MLNSENIFNFTYNKNSIRFLIDDDDWIPKTIRSSQNFYEISLLEKIKQYLDPSDLILDVGANIGNHTIYFSKICGCEVIAFEAVHKNFEKLKTNVKLNNVGDQVQCFNFGLGKEEGKATFSQPSTSNSGSFKLAQYDLSGDISIKKLDSLDIFNTKKRIQFVKLDVEGMEYDVLKGALNTIQEHLPLLSIEIKTNEEFYKIYDLLMPLQYSVIGVFNATPTFLFASEEYGGDIDALRKSIRALSVYYIDVKRRSK